MLIIPYSRFSIPYFIFRYNEQTFCAKGWLVTPNHQYGVWNTESEILLNTADVFFTFALMQKKGGITGNIYLSILLRLCLVILLLWLSRISFYIFNTQYFSGLTASEFLKITFYGLRFDLSAAVMVNLPWLVLNIIPVRNRYRKFYQKPVNILLYYTPNIIALGANFIDTVYFRFTLKRMTGDIFQFVSAEENEIAGLIPRFLTDFWPVFLSWIVFSVLLIYFGSKIQPKLPKHFRDSLGHYFAGSLIFLIIGAISVIAIRGGFQLKPISIVTAAEYSSARNIPLVLNTPFSIIKTIGQQGLQQKHYFSKEMLQQVYNPVHKPETDSLIPLKKKNVVIIILESFSTEHIASLNPTLQKDGYEGFTPFLDSLIKKSIAFKGFANGKRSIEAIPAIISGLPSLMHVDFLTSIYSGNKINSMPDMLKDEGYSTSFFHGGNNGTMSFDAFARMAGYDSYYGRNEYNNDEDFDGKWGIFDEAFFQYFAQKLNDTPQPFFTTFFSLSSHHPYTIPDKHQGRFKIGNLDIQESIMYTDYALMKFFETASSMPWFDNTVFVITADHTSEAYREEYKSNIGNYQVPIIFFIPGMDTSQVINTTAQHTDIMPTLMNFLDYNKEFIAFGTDLFDPDTDHFAINYPSGTYQLIRGDFVFVFDGEKPISLYNRKRDINLREDLLDKDPVVAKELEKLIKAIIQQYNNRMISNELTVVNQQ